jgi:hypothetical protein
MVTVGLVAMLMLVYRFFALNFPVIAQPADEVVNHESQQVMRTA